MAVSQNSLRLVPLGVSSRIACQRLPDFADKENLESQGIRSTPKYTKSNDWWKVWNSASMSHRIGSPPCLILFNPRAERQGSRCPPQSQLSSSVPGESMNRFASIFLASSAPRAIRAVIRESLRLMAPRAEPLWREGFRNPL